MSAGIAAMLQLPAVQSHLCFCGLYCNPKGRHAATTDFYNQMRATVWGMGCCQRGASAAACSVIVLVGLTNGPTDNQLITDLTV